MTFLRNTPGRGQEPPRSGKKKPFRLFETLRERSYRRTVMGIESAEKRLEELGQKRDTFARLSKSSCASVVNEGESNWDEAMAHARAYSTSRKALKSESATAAFCLFSNTIFKVALFGGASIVLLHTAMPDMSLAVDILLGAVLTVGAALRTWAAVTTGNEDFLRMVSATLDKQKASLESERNRLIKKLHGWKSAGE